MSNPRRSRQPTTPNAATPSQSVWSRAFVLLFGRRLKNSEENQEKVGAAQGVPILGLDALGSSSYGPEAALMILLPLGAAGLAWASQVLGVILILLTILYFSYRQTIAEYPGGGGSYTVARENLGKGSGLLAAAALLLDYVLNVAVGVSAGVGALESAFPSMQSHTLTSCLVVLSLITLVNLRGVRDSGFAWTVPTYAYLGSMLVVIAVGAWKAFSSGGHPTPVSAPLPLEPETGVFSMWLLLHAFASGCTAMTGVEAVSNGVPIFAEPAVKRARQTLAFICAALGILLAGIGYLVRTYQIGAHSQEAPGYESVVSQLVGAVMGRGAFYYVTIGSLLAVLTLSANTSYAGFPRLCRVLAEDSYLPSAFANLGRRLVNTFGIICLALISGLLLVCFNGVTERLIPLFAIGAFGAFTFSQLGMVLHWRRQGKHWLNPALLINAVGAIVTGGALVVIVVAKFTDGAWITVVVIPIVVAIFARIRFHYAQVRREIRPPLELRVGVIRPLKIVIPIEGWNRVSERAIRLALQISDDVTAIHIKRDHRDLTLATIWREHIEEPARRAGFQPPKLEVIDSPYRMLFDPLLDYIRRVLEQNPECMLTVVIPELVRPRWWEYLLHNYLAGTLKALLLLNGDDRIVVINAPWYLREQPGPRVE